jgi:hypothetical protein
MVVFIKQTDYGKALNNVKMVDNAFLRYTIDYSIGESIEK